MLRGRLQQDPPGRASLVWFHGSTGIGKTVLLSRTRRMIRHSGAVVVNLTCDEKLGVIPLMSELWRHLGREIFGDAWNGHWWKKLTAAADLEKFRIWRRLARFQRETSIYERLRLQLEQVLEEEAAELRTELRRAILFGGILLFNAGRQGTIDTDAVEGVLKHLPRGLLRRAQLDVLVNPAFHLTPYFVDAMNEIASHRRLFVMIDDFHKSEERLRPWMLRLLGGEFHTVSPSITIIVASQLEPSRRLWLEPAAEYIQSRKLAKFTRDHVWECVQKSFDLKKPENVDLQELQEEVESIFRLSDQGLPLKVTYYADRAFLGKLHSSDAAWEEIRSIVRPIFERAPDPDLRSALQACAVPRYLGRELVRELLDEPLVERSFAWFENNVHLLEDSPFRRRRLNSSIRSDLLAYLFIDDRDRYESLHLRMAAYYESKLRPDDTDLLSSLDNDERWDWLIQRFYHRLSASPQQVVDQGVDDFLRLLETPRRESLGEWIAVYRTVFRERRIPDALLDRARTLEEGLETLYRLDARIEPVVDGSSDVQHMIDWLRRILDNYGLSEQAELIGRSWKASLHVECGQADEGAMELERMLAIEPDDRYVRALLVKARLDSGNVNDALRIAGTDKQWLLDLEGLEFGEELYRELTVHERPDPPCNGDG